MIDYCDEIISNKSLTDILDFIHPYLLDKNQISFEKNWRKFIFYFANEKVAFIDSNKQDSHFEWFTLPYEFANTSLSIQFDISRILKSISNNKIIPLIQDYSVINNDLYFNKVEIDGFKIKSVPPILVYLPCYIEDRISHYVVLDGNHRISFFSLSNQSHPLYVIPSLNLELHHFTNLNSWIAFHLISGFHYAQELSVKDFRDYLNGLETLLTRSASLFEFH